MAPSARSSRTVSSKPEDMAAPDTSVCAPGNTFGATPFVKREEQPALDKATDLAAGFKTDLTNIKNLVTCSICDQLLYEPWTLSCGHTYCYSCLCNWFIPNKKKKTCPECRTLIKQMPAPAFLVKQMVEILCKRGEIMPSDESVDQHHQKRAEETADVERDRNSSEGLFKGTFRTIPVAELQYDEADGVMRCSGCHHEHEGGPTCVNCGLDFEGYGEGENAFSFSDFDSEIDEDLELDQLDMDADFEHGGHFHHFLGQLPHVHHFPNGPLGPGHAHFHRHHHHHHHYDDSLGQSSDRETSEDSDEDVEDDEDEGSLQDFVVRDEEDPENNRQTITISDDDDDDSDEGGPVNPRRRLHNRRQITLSPSLSPGAPSYLTITESENGDGRADAEMLRGAGWSSLDNSEAETDDEDQIRQSYRSYEELEEHSDDESDTNTMRNDVTEAEDDISRDNSSATPTYNYNGERYFRDEGTPNSYDYDSQSEADFPRSMDGDGDTEMSGSPQPLSPGFSVDSRYGYGTDGADDLENERTPREYRHESISTNGGLGATGEHLGLANEIHEIEDDDSSDVSIRPPARRRPRQQRALVQQTDPRISLMFAEHQLSLRGALARREAFEVEDGRVDSAARNRRMISYRLPTPRRIEPSSSQSPFATRVISSTSRVARPPRQYQRRYL